MSFISRSKIVVTLFLLFFVLQAIASRQDTRQAEFKYADEKLNVVYKKIISMLQLSDQIKLKKAQQAWIVFRDMDCAWAYGAESVDCLVDRTDRRAKELKQTEFFDKKADFKRPFFYSKFIGK